MLINFRRARQLLQGFQFRNLFIEELGWANPRIAPVHLEVDGARYQLTPVAEQGGMFVFEVTNPKDGSLPNCATRLAIERQLTPRYYEHLLIFTNAARTVSVWQWVKREAGKAAAREHRYDKSQPGDSLLQKLQGIAFSFDDLDEEGKTTIGVVLDRVRANLDVERVTKRFYDEFKKHHEAFLQFITGIEQLDNRQWYASVMLNRLMFIYFIQKKGFLGGDTDYLSNKLLECQAQGINYYRDFLCPLFFEGFARKPHERSAEVNRLLGSVPYLNGGLFLPHQLEKEHPHIAIGDEAFERLFAFFNRYTWHLDDRPLRNDNEINPDVLGYIFEKYINQKQMGAYYTKEDITEYISKNTIIPFIFDSVAKKYPAAFKGERSVWSLLKDDPDRYIYPAVKKGVELPLPPEVAAGISDVSKRTEWNKPAPPDYALPTEIWREVVARRKRYEEIKSEIRNPKSEIGINDLITYNLNIRQFAQDAIEDCETPELLCAFYHAITSVTVLDLTCGSGAFLFAALNVLEPLYDTCLNRMVQFVADYDRSADILSAGHAGSVRYAKFSDFRAVLERIRQHPNRDYFILKSIIVNNLYGVDIMEEAVEICKLRLFLKLVAQVERVEDIEPLPDIDFNIRAGNTLVGYATYDEVKRAVGSRLDFDDTMQRIEEKAQDVDRLFALFRQQQTELGGEVTPADKQNLRNRLKELEDELNRYLAEEYQTGLSAKPQAYDQWLRSHKPFHWFIEFYGIIKGGGFDVIIGNPPYVEYRLVRDTYRLQQGKYRSETADNLYAFCMERSCVLLRQSGWFGMIVPTGVIGLDETVSLRDVLLERFTESFCSTYAIRPSKLFDGVDQRLCIYLGEGGKDSTHRIWATRYHHWNAEERDTLFPRLEYTDSFHHQRLKRIPQVGSIEAASVLAKLEAKSKKTALHYCSTNRSGYLMHYHRSPRYWIRAMDFEQYFKSPTRTRSVHHFRDIYFKDKDAGKVVGAILNSSLFFFWFVSVGNGRNITGTDVEQFPLGDLGEDILRDLPRIFDRLMKDYKENSFIRVRQDCEFQEFRPSKSKPLIDEIDRVLAKHYGFTDEELDFIINYDIKYRMGREAGEENDQ